MDKTELLQIFAQALQENQPVQQRAMTVDNHATPFGCCNFFDRCGDGDLISLHYAGALPLLDWMGFNVGDECYRTVEFINYLRPEMVGGRATPGYLGDPCEDPNGLEFGSCKLTVEDFGRIGRLGPTRDIMQPKKYCLTDPVWRLDGTRVMDEREWDSKFVADAVVADISRLLVTGNSATAGQFDGLERWVRTGYDCGMLDSIVIDWNGNPMAGGNGITWNGNAVANTYDIVDVLLAVFRRFKQRISWAPRLRTQPLNPGNMILVMPHDLINCLLDFYTCWSVCKNTDDNPDWYLTMWDTPEARAFRNSLNGGLFGAGQITLDGVTISILGYDWELLKGPKTGDFYFLSGAVGSFRIWEGEHINAAAAVATYPENGYWSTDGGRMLWKLDTENECRTLKGWIHPRLFCRAPFLQARFQSVQCEGAGGFLSPDPLTSWYPETSFSAAVCP